MRVMSSVSFWQEELVEKLRAFHLSTDKAKIYAYLCKVDEANVSDISEATNIQPQDIYRRVTELEKKGLVRKNETRPLTIKAVSPEIALRALVNLIKLESEKEIRILSKYCREIVSEQNKVPRMIKSTGSSIVLFEKGISNYSSFENAKQEFDFIRGDRTPPPPYPKQDVGYGKRWFKRLVKRNVKIRFLIINNKNEFHVEATKKMMPKSNCELRTLVVKDFKSFPFFSIRDSEELWLPVPSIGKEDASILTDVRELVELAKCSFESLWNDPNVKIEGISASNANATE